MARTPQEKESLQREIENTDKSIDRRVPTSTLDSLERVF